MDIWLQLRLSDGHSQQLRRGQNGGEEFPVSVAITPNGAFAYVANSASSTVSVINTATNTVIATVPVGSTPHSPAITLDGAFVYGTNRIFITLSIIDTTTNTVVYMISGIVELSEGIAIMHSRNALNSSCREGG